MADNVLDYVLDAFESQGYGPGLRGEIAWLPGEAFITLIVSQPTEALHQFARDIESEFDELGRSVHIRVRRPVQGLPSRLTHWLGIGD